MVTLAETKTARISNRYALCVRVERCITPLPPKIQGVGPCFTPNDSFKRALTVGARQGLLKVVNQIVHVFDPDRQSQQARMHGKAFSGYCLAMLDQALDPT